MKMTRRNTSKSNDRVQESKIGVHKANHKEHRVQLIVV